MTNLPKEIETCLTIIRQRGICIGCDCGDCPGSVDHRCDEDWRSVLDARLQDAVCVQNAITYCNDHFQKLTYAEYPEAWRKVLKEHWDAKRVIEFWDESAMNWVILCNFVPVYMSCYRLVDEKREERLTYCGPSKDRIPNVVIEAPDCGKWACTEESCEGCPDCKGITNAFSEEPEPKPADELINYFNEAKAAVGDCCVFTEDQVTLLHCMIDNLKEAWNTRAEK